MLYTSKLILDESEDYKAHLNHIVETKKYETDYFYCIVLFLYSSEIFQTTKQIITEVSVLVDKQRC
jgi:hypothetical protein